MRTSKFMGVVAAGLFALTLGAGQAGALAPGSPNGPVHGISQIGGNFNQTSQEAKSTAVTKQANLNLPISLFTVGSNDGGVYQSNGANTSAQSSNENATKQKLDQDQKVSEDTHGSKPGPKPGPKPCDKKPCDKKQGDKNRGDKNRGDKPGKDGSPARNVSQRGGNENHTSQDAKSKATTKQTNVNQPISAFAVGSNDGRVSQKNWADTSAKSSNRNSTDQSLHQRQDVKGNGGESGSKGPKGPEGPNGPQGPEGPKGPESGGVSQSGSNKNSTHQDAKSEATTEQLNVNAPISLFSVGSNNGDVRQSNGADTTAKSSNDNWTDQSAHQNQSVSGKGSGDVSQSGKNDNSTDQHAKSEATTKQANVNLPISLFSVGSNDGGVQQGNSASTHAGSSNSNGTQQLLGQGQGVGSVPGW
jgi:hypothetical protein